MKFANARPYADPEAAARKPIEIANSVEAVQDGRIFIELISGPMLFDLKATPVGYTTDLQLDRSRLAQARQVRNLCEVHPGRCRFVRMNEAAVVGGLARATSIGG
jgi:hypothetical protein